MTNNSASVAVVGCGHWGKNLVRNFSEIGQLAAISDPLDENTAPLIEKFGVRNITFDEVLSDPTIAGVAIAAPAPLHAKLAKACLEADKHLMVEKPITLETDDARMLIELAKRQNKLLMVGHLLNYHNAFLKMVEMVDAGAVGKIHRIYSNRLSFGKVRVEENALWSFAPHDISMILRLMGGERPEKISAIGQASISHGIEDFCHLHMDFASGIGAHIHVSWLNPFKEQKLVVIGEDAMMVFDDVAPLEQKLALYGHNAAIEGNVPVLKKAEAEYIEVAASEPLKQECQAFIAGMQDPSSVYTDGEEGLAVLDVLSRAQKHLGV